MMVAIHSEGKERGAVQDFDGVALIHAEVQIKEHRSPRCRRTDAPPASSAAANQ